MDLKSVAILEFVCGGGVPDELIDSLNPSLQREGRVMLESLAADWSKIPGRTVHVAWDRNLGEWRIPGVHVHECNEEIPVCDAWLKIAVQVDAVLVIAPELNNELIAATDGLRQKLPPTVKLLNADPVFCHAASDKWLTSRCLKAAAVFHPETILWGRISSMSDLPQSSNSTWVLKPRDGAGCESILRFRNLQELTCMPKLFSDLSAYPDKWIVQPWIEGEHGSLAVLCGGNERLVFPPMTQNISIAKGGMGHFLHYQGGSGPWWPVQPEMIDQFAKTILDAIPGTPYGWIGVDFVVSKNCLGEPELVAIEINPRLTTSYLGVRAIVQENIPSLLEAVADGVPTKYSKRNSTVHFTTFGVSEEDELESR